MSNALNTAVVGDAVPGEAEWPAAGARRHRVSAGEQACCFHCGEVCPDLAFAEGEKVFCCQGCRVVHDLLAENGLERFYELGNHPGVGVRGAAGRDPWSYLDEPGLQQRLLDFTDGRQSRVTLHLPAIHCAACRSALYLSPDLSRADSCCHP